MVKFSDRTSQLGVFHVGTPNYVSVPNSDPIPGMVTFDWRGGIDGWITGDVLSVLVAKDSSNYAVWLGTWDSTALTISLLSELEAVGALPDEAEVTVTAVISSAALQQNITNPEYMVPVYGVFVEYVGSSITLGAADNGKCVVFPSESAVSVTIPDTLPVGFHCLLIREGTGTVNLSISGTDTINGGISPVPLSAQFTGAYLYQRVEGSWGCLA